MGKSIYLKCGATLSTNEKIGCYTFNLSPLTTCRDKPCFGKGCYALGGVIDPRTKIKGPRYESCTKSLDRNYRALEEKFEGHIGHVVLAVQIAEAINSRELRYFRWLSSGDVTPKLIPVIRYVAKKCPETDFLLFTKDIAIAHVMYEEYPNLHVIYSTWPGWKMNPMLMNYRHAVVVPSGGADPQEYFKCPGRCSSCRECWNGKRNWNIAFKAHGPFAKRIKG